jgi:hypothetical protein
MLRVGLKSRPTAAREHSERRSGLPGFLWPCQLLLRAESQELRTAPTPRGAAQKPIASLAAAQKRGAERVRRARRAWCVSAHAAAGGAAQSAAQSAAHKRAAAIAQGARIPARMLPAAPALGVSWASVRKSLSISALRAATELKREGCCVSWPREAGLHLHRDYSPPGSETRRATRGASLLP